MVAVKQLVQTSPEQALSYLVVVEKTDTGFSAFVPDVPGVVAAAESREKLLELLSDALCLHFVRMQEDGEEVPESVTQQYEDEDLDQYEVTFVTPSQPDQVSLEIDQLVRSSGLKYADVARRMDVPRSVVSRLSSPIYRGHSMESLRKLARALGYEVEVSFKRVD